MALRAGGPHLEPELTFFRHFNEIAARRPRVGHDIEIVGPEQFRGLLQHVGQTVIAAGLLVGHEDQT